MTFEEIRVFQLIIKVIHDFLKVYIRHHNKRSEFIKTIIILIVYQGICDLFGEYS